MTDADCARGWRAEVLEAFERIGRPGKPLTASEIATDRGWPRRVARDRLDRLVEAGTLGTRTLDPDTRVWWISPGDEPAESRSERLFRAVFEEAFDAMLIADDDARYVDANPAACALFGLPEERLLGRTIREFAPEDYDFDEAWRRFRESDRDRGIFPLVRADGERRLVEFAATPNVVPGRHLSILRDVTERERRERELQASNERLEEFASAISHDLEEPLRTVSNYLALLEDRYGDALDEEGQEFLAFAHDGAERMREMIAGLLEVSRVETRGNPFEPVDLEVVFDDVVETLSVRLEETDAELTAEPLPRVYGDERQLRRLFQNLLSNAVTYAGDDRPRVHVAVARRGEWCEIAVSDEGIGIDPADAERIFDVFQRLHTYEEHAGTGIGLALCRRIVERHGGEIWVDSEPGEGTTFAFTLPAAPDPRE